VGPADFGRCTGLFEWDERNRRHIRRHSGVTQELVEQAATDPIAVDFGSTIVNGEERFHLIGATADRRLLTVIYELREESVRVITAYWASSKERSAYEEN
jgi:uncharacterized DUF497 family protein